MILQQTWAARTLTKSCASGPGPGASAWPPIWCPTTWGSTRAGLIEHPDWFISLDYSPFPSYSFNGPNLSWDERVGIYIEDHYFDNSDAAVVFKRGDNWTGQEKYIYHGNDGTSMPWNDTAQLDYLKPEVREAVIQTILHVARKFPIIRFDAAMTLAKRHFQRLWYPEPGTGGDIPSRAEHGMTKEQFEAAMPDRVLAGSGRPGGPGSAGHAAAG